MRTTTTGKLGRVIFARLEPGEDLYEAVLDIVESEGIDSGVVLDMTGAATRLRVQLPVSATAGKRPATVFEAEGLTEILGSGIIGRVEEDFVSGDGAVQYHAGKPYAHIHVSATVNGETHTGHLLKGTLVRSVIPESHFTIAIAEVEGVHLALRVNQDATGDYPAGIPYHTVSAV